MIQRLLIFGLFCLLTSPLLAQECTPDETYRDSAFAIVPLPRSASNPNGGIDLPACLNEEYNFTYTFKLPLTVSVSGFNIPIDSVILDRNDPNTVTGQPSGIDYACDPPSCKFDPRVDSLVCVILKGVPDDAVGNYPLKIKIQLYNPIFPPFYALEFPNTTISGFDGDYTIELREEGNCEPLSVADLSKEFDIKVQPNPFAFGTQVNIVAQRDEEMTLTVIDLLGKVVHQQDLQLWSGQNQVAFDGSDLSNGIYQLSLHNERGQTTKKLIVQR